MSEELLPPLMPPFGLNHVAVKPVLETTEGAPTKEFLQDQIAHWRRGERLKTMIDGDRYYRNKTDIMLKKRTYLNRFGKPCESPSLANTKLQHDYFRSLVNQKVDFFLSKQFSITCENAKFSEILNSAFVNDDFLSRLNTVGVHAISRGISWLQAYYDKDGVLNFKRIPSEQVIPFWNDEDRTILEAVIRVYKDRVLLAAGGSKIVEHVEYYTANGVWKCELSEKGDVVEVSSAPVIDGHFANGKDKIPFAWGRVPFVAFKYSADEYALIESVKSLIDDFNEIDSEFSNTLKDLKQGLKIIKGYSGSPEEKNDWEERMNKHRLVFVDADGKVENLENKVEADPFTKRLDLHDKAIYKESKGVNTYGEDFGDASGKALQTRYQPLQSDCEKIAGLFAKAIKELAWFIKVDLVNRSKGDFMGVDFQIVWNMDMTADETEIIDNIVKSEGFLSKKTLLSNHPFVKDVGKELEQIALEKKEDEDANASSQFEFSSDGSDKETDDDNADAGVTSDEE